MSAPNSSSSSRSRPQNISYADLMKPDEDWRMLPDAAERRKIQNRLAQRAYRRNMRNRTKELEKLKKELAQLKEGGSNDASSNNNEQPTSTHSSPQLLPQALMMQQQQQQQQMHLMANTDDFVFDGGMVDSMSSWGAPQAQFTDQPLHIDPSFFATPTPSSSSRSSSSKRRRTSSSSSGMHTPPPRTNSGSSLPGGHRSRSHTPLPCPPPVVHNNNNHSGMHTPPPATVAELQQQTSSSQQMLALSPCDFGLADPMTLPPLDGADSPPSFSLDSFAAGPDAASFDQGLWTPPLQSRTSMYGAFLTPPTEHGFPVASPPAMNSVETSSSEQQQQQPQRPSFSSSSASSSSRFSSPSISSTNSSSSSSANTAMSSTTTTEEKGGSSNSLLHLAVAGGHVQVLQLLLQRCEIPIDTRDGAGYTALQRAVTLGRSEMVALLLEAGADFSSADKPELLLLPPAVATTTEIKKGSC